MQAKEVHVFNENDPSLKGLMDAKQCLIVQKPDWMEYLCPCCDFANEYMVYNTNDTYEQQLMPLAQVKEQSNCICQFCCRHWRSFDADISVGGQQHAKMKRFCRLPCFPYCASITLCKQESMVTKIDGTKVGSAEWPTWCSGCVCCRGATSCQELDIKDATGNVVYKLSSSVCQCGYICGHLGACGPCQRRHYPLTDVNGNVVGEITNECSGVVNELYTRADNFAIKFPPGCSIETKLTLIQTAILIDFIQYWA